VARNLPLPTPPSVDPLYWEDCCDYTYASASIARGGGFWPSMVSVEWPEEGTYTSDDLRGLAAMLIRAADLCDESTREVFGEREVTS
jgi:hypothetical protein